MDNNFLIWMYFFGLLILLALVIFEYPDYKKFREEMKRKKKQSTPQ